MLRVLWDIFGWEGSPLLISALVTSRKPWDPPAVSVGTTRVQPSLSTARCINTLCLFGKQGACAPSLGISVPFGEVSFLQSEVSIWD